MHRRRKGATLALVVVCMLIIIMIGIAAYFLAKLMGGGREVANSTDASTLKVARDAILKITVSDQFGGYDFSDCCYPFGSGTISLLTYNRCVAKALMIAINAAQIGGQAPGNAAGWITAVNSMGAALDGNLKSQAPGLYSDVGNSLKMFGNNAINKSGSDVAYMKTGGATNVYFPTAVFVNQNGQSIPAPSFIPFSNGNIQPDNSTAAFQLPGASGVTTRYMAGYQPINVPGVGGTLYGVPVFPSQQPHLVSLSDFNTAKNGAHGSAPCNAFMIQSKTQDKMTGAYGGAVAAAIIGAVNSVGGAGGGGGGGGGGSGPFGNGFQYVPALSWGYIEFDNLPANPTPPKYNPDDYKDNIFNNELLAGPLEASGNASQNSNIVMFSTSPNGTVANWVNWANNSGAAPYPAGSVYIGLKGANLNPAVSQTNPPTAAQINQMKQVSPNPADCYQQLWTQAGLIGPCVGGITAMEATFNHNLPNYASPNPTPNFSQTDWAKASVIVAFESPGPNNAGNNSVTVDLTSGAPISGLGVFNGLEPYPTPQLPNPLASPQYPLPLEQTGSIYDLIRTVQQPGCVTDTINQITNRAQQIQPKASAGQIRGMLNTPLPMAPNGSSQPNKLFIYLPGGDLSASLVCNAGPPPKYSGPKPDGAPASAACYQNTVYLDGLLVDSPNDQLVHIRPYVQMIPPDPASGMQCIDHADWTPGSGSNNCMGLMTFEEIGIGQCTFQHIN